MKMSLRLSVWILLGLAAVPMRARANDMAVSGVTGSARPLKGEHPDIQMVRERVWIEVFGDSYTTTADFEFLNHGPAQSVAMGFPEQSYGDVASASLLKKSSFKSFATWVDGRRASARRVALSNTESDDFEALWVKTVFFGAHQRRHIRVRTESSPGSMVAYSSEGGGRLASYNFSGGNWKGNVQESILVAVPHGKGTSIKSVSVGRGPKPSISRRRGRQGQWLRYRWANWSAESIWSVTYTRPSPKK